MATNARELNDHDAELVEQLEYFLRADTSVPTEHIGLLANNATVLMQLIGCLREAVVDATTLYLKSAVRHEMDRSLGLEGVGVALTEYQYEWRREQFQEALEGLREGLDLARGLTREALYDPRINTWGEIIGADEGYVA